MKRGVALVLAAGLVGGCSHGSSPPEVLAVDDDLRADRAAAVDGLESRCQSGQLDACHTLANLYRDGGAGEVDPHKAQQLYGDTCEKGYAASCSSLAYLLLTTKAAPGDVERAFTLYDRACTLGEAVSCNNLGAFYQQGTAVPADPTRAAGYYTQACDKGVMQGCVGLAELYASGQGIPQNETMAANLQEKACTGGVTSACTTYGKMVRDGKGVVVDAQRAENIFRQSCGHKEVTSCTELGNIFALPVLTSQVPPKFPAEAKTQNIQEAKTKVQIEVDVEGNVVHPQIVSGLSMFGEPVLAAISQWKYKPATLEGAPIPVVFVQEFVFRLE